MAKKMVAEEELIEILRDDQRYIEAFLKIKSKDGATIPLHFNRVQQIVYGEIERLRAEGLPVRLVILKARQQGISTLTQALFFKWCVTQKQKEALTITHEPKATANLFRMQKDFFAELPAEIKPMKRYDKANQRRL